MSISSLLQSADKDFRSGQRDLDVSRRLSTARSFITAIGGDDEEAAHSLFDDYKESVELSGSLARFAENSRDSARGEKMSQIKQRIEQLKEMLRFATPEQAERLLKELKQISKEFKKAAQGLAEAGNGLPSGSATSTLSAPASSGTVVTVVNAGVPANTPGGTASATGAEPDAGSPPADVGAAGMGAISSEGSQEGESGWQSDLTTAIQTYSERQEQTDKANRSGRASALKTEREELSKTAEEIKKLAERLEKLAKEDDENAKKELKDVRENLIAGQRALNDPSLKGGEGLSAPTTSGSFSVNGSGVTVSSAGSVSILSEVIV